MRDNISSLKISQCVVLRNHSKSFFNCQLSCSTVKSQLVATSINQPHVLKGNIFLNLSNIYFMKFQHTVIPIYILKTLFNFSCPLIENFIWIEPLLRGHLSYKVIFICPKSNLLIQVSRVDPWFQVRGGALKKIAPSGGRRENCWGISCEYHIFSKF